MGALYRAHSEFPGFVPAKLPDILDLWRAGSYIEGISASDHVRANAAMSSNQTIQLVVLAAIAIFLILRLRGVLGTRDGFEPSQPVEPPIPTSHPDVTEGEVGEDDDIADHVDPASPAAKALHAIRDIESDFLVGPFLTGARQAYEMILMAFEQGDLSNVRAFLADPVADAFQAAIDARTNRGERIEAEFHGISETKLITAEMDPASQNAEITIRFVAELTEAIFDGDENLVSGDASKPRKQRDTWTFGRRVGDPDPNWRLVATG